MIDFMPIIAQIDSSALSISYLAIGPEIILAAGAALVLMVEVFYKPRHTVHAGLVFSTLVQDNLRAIVRQAHGLHLDIFDVFLEPLEQELRQRRKELLARPVEHV